MRNLIVKDDKFIDIDIESRKEYSKFIKFNLKYADQIIFTVYYRPKQYEKLKEDVKSKVNLDVIDSGFCCAASDMEGQKSHLIEIENNYNLYKYLMNYGDYFEFNEEYGMKDVCFLKAGQVYCYTVTHERMCIMAEEEEKMFESEKK